MLAGEPLSDNSCEGEGDVAGGGVGVGHSPGGGAQSMPRGFTPRTSPGKHQSRSKCGGYCKWDLGKLNIKMKKQITMCLKVLICSDHRKL